jgi:hypothetical protein
MIPINNWKDICNQLKDKQFTLQNCPEYFGMSLEIFYHWQKMVYQVGDNK